MNQGPNDSTHLDGCVNEPLQTDRNDIQGQPGFENQLIQRHKEIYWAKEHAGHIWNDNCGWLVVNPASPQEPWWIEDPLPRFPSDPDYLCDVCCHINFCWFFENNKSRSTHSFERGTNLGTVGHILKQANCSFCVLLASSCQEHASKDDFVQIDSTCFSEFFSSSGIDCNHPETEVKYLFAQMGRTGMTLQVLDDSRPMRGRQISPYIKQQQQNIARQWLQKCEHEHCNCEDEALVSNLALIDLNQRCIVRPHGPVRYAALSYVWGKSPQKMYSTTTQQDFETKGTLHSKQGFLPQTITDAMDLAAHIGLDYLWVDSLCILQDDDADKIYFISRMGTIYGTSAITIVDANGSTADSGLVGMSSPRENRYKIATVQGMQLCTPAGLLNSPFQEFAACAWLKRGWTYQEMLLSKRLLLVTHRQLQFVCNHAVYVEELHPHSPRTGDWTMQTDGSVPIRRSEAAGKPISYLYYDAVQKFTLRALTYDLDVIPAFDAVFKALYKNTEAKSLFNLPDVDIEEALLWESGIRHDRTPSSMSRMARRRHPDRLPTWSWAGWRGEIAYAPIRKAPLISAVLWRCASTPAVDKRSELTLQDYRCTNWREKGWNYRSIPHWIHHAYTHDSRPNVYFQNPIALEPHSGLHKPSFLDDSNVLHFSAFTVHISASEIMTSLRLDGRGGISNTKMRHVLDSCQYLAGTIFLDCLPDNGVGLRLVALARCSAETIVKWQKQLGIEKNIAPLDWNPEYFKNISQPNDLGKTDEDYSWHRRWEIWDKRRFPDKFYPLYNSLLVEMREGIAYRVGIGKVHIDAFHAANPVWEEVRLG